MYISTHDTDQNPILPGAVDRITWPVLFAQADLCHSEKAVGRGWFMGHTLEMQGNITQHLVIHFKAGKDSVFFNASDNLGFKVGDLVPLRYDKAHPTDARVNTTFGLWMDVLINSLLPELVLLILFITPDRFDPLIPWKARIRIGIKPFIKIIYFC